MNKEEVLKFVIEEAIFENLELMDLGIALSDIKYNTSLKSNDGLSLDSVEVLDVLVAVQRRYNLQLEEITPEMMNLYCDTPSSLVDFVISKY